MSIETQTEFSSAEKSAYLINLVHDEFLESIIQGYDEEYRDWAIFASECVRKILLPLVPSQRDALPD